MPQPAPPLYVFPHVPKCAGSSISQFLRSNLPDEAVMRVDKPDRAAVIRGDEAARIAIGGAICALGHYVPHAITSLAAPGREVREMVLIRDPVGYFRSLYVFNKTHSRKPRVRALAFERWYSHQPRNPIVRALLTDYFMLPDWREVLMSEDACVRYLSERLSAFWFVGSHRHCQALIDRLGSELDLPVVPYHRNAAAAPFELPAGYEDRILADNRADAALFETWGDRLWDKSRDSERMATAPGTRPLGRLAQTVVPRIRRALFV